jgi:hypothetical protein
MRMKTGLLAATIALGFAAFAATSSQAADTTLEPMPAKLETQFALSALPPTLRAKATVYLLDPKQGYSIARQGTNGIACVVERTVWEMADFRDDLYIPLCYDAAGIHGHFQAIIDSAALRAQGMSPATLKAEIEKRYRNKSYKTPERAGLSYMVAPVMRALGPPDMKVHTMAMPHLMFYAPGVTNADIGALPDIAVPATLQYPFIDRQGNAEQSYMIQMVGATEKAKIVADEKQLLDALCAHRDVLCLGGAQHH